MTDFMSKAESICCEATSLHVRGQEASAKVLKGRILFGGVGTL